MGDSLSYLDNLLTKYIGKALIQILKWRHLSGFSTAIRMHEWPREQANLHVSKQIILQVFSWGYGLNIYLNL